MLLTVSHRENLLKNLQWKPSRCGTVWYSGLDWNEDALASGWRKANEIFGCRLNDAYHEYVGLISFVKSLIYNYVHTTGQPGHSVVQSPVPAPVILLPVPAGSGNFGYEYGWTHTVLDSGRFPLQNLHSEVGMTRPVSLFRHVKRKCDMHYCMCS